MIYRENLGIGEFDRRVGGIPTSGFNVVETPNHKTGISILGHYLMEGLKNGEHCSFVSFENPVSFIEHFDEKKFDFSPYTKSVQLSYLNFNPTVSVEMGLIQDYNQVFDEILQLSTNTVRRIAIHQVDTLFSLHNHSLIRYKVKLFGVS